MYSIPNQIQHPLSVYDNITSDLGDMCVESA